MSAVVSLLGNRLIHKPIAVRRHGNKVGCRKFINEKNIYYRHINFNNIVHIRLCSCFLQVSIQKFCKHFTCHPFMLRVPPISSFLFSSLKKANVSRPIDYEFHRYVIIPLLLLPSFINPDILHSTLLSNSTNLCKRPGFIPKQNDKHNHCILLYVYISLKNT
jgi:hypothetical protein